MLMAQVIQQTNKELMKNLFQMVEEASQEEAVWHYRILRQEIKEMLTQINKQNNQLNKLLVHKISLQK